MKGRYCGSNSEEGHCDNSSYKHVSKSEWLEIEGGYNKRIADCHFGCCCLHKET
jgi:hypothetical protein